MTDVKVTLESGGRNRALLVVEDDEPEGSMNLAHAFTLLTDSANNFASSIVGGLASFRA